MHSSGWPMFRFTIRDVLLVMVIVGLTIGWAVDHSNARATMQTVRRELLATRVLLRESGGFAEWRNDAWTIGDDSGNYVEFSRDSDP
jgi:hypothetical protein